MCAVARVSGAAVKNSFKQLGIKIQEHADTQSDDVTAKHIFHRLPNVQQIRREAYVPGKGDVQWRYQSADIDSLLHS